MGRASSKKKKRRELLSRGVPKEGKQDMADVPGPFQNVILRPVNSLVTLRGKDPKQTLSDGQMLVTLDRYAVIPLEQYNDLLRIAKNKAGAVEMAANISRQVMKSAAARGKPMRPQPPQIVRPSDGDVAHVQATKVPDAEPKPAGEDSQ